MKPTFKVTVSNPESGKRTDITDAINNRLIEIAVHDQLQMRNDRLTIRIDDRKDDDGNYISLPEKGFLFDVEMGYITAPGHDNPYEGTLPLGTFTLDEMELEKDDHGRRVALTGHAIDMTASKLKEQRTSCYWFTTLGKVVDEVCSRIGLTAVVHKSKQDVVVDRVYQVCESDLFFLVRLGKLYGCLVKVQEGKVYFSPQDDVQEVQDIVQDDISVDESDMINYHYLTQGAGRYGSVRAKYFDYDAEGGNGLEWVEYSIQEELATQAAQMQAAGATYDEMVAAGVAGSAVTGPAAELQRIYANATEAMEAAQSRLRMLLRSLDTFTFSSYGDPTLLSGGFLSLTGLRPEIPTDWTIVKVAHHFTSSGYICDVDCESPLSGYKHNKKRKKVRRGTSHLPTIANVK